MCICALLSDFFVQPIFAQTILPQTSLTPWQTQSPLPGAAVVRKAFFLNERVGWLVGRDTVVLKTSNGGQSWEVQTQTNLPRNLFSVREFFDVRAINEQVVWAMANAGTILTRDGGRTWTRVTGGGNAIFALDERRAWVFDDTNLSDGIVLRTRNGGISWDTTRILGAVPREGYFVDSLRGVFVSRSGVFASSDGGATWANISPNVSLGGNTNYSSLWLVNSTLGFVGADDSTLVRTTDGGRTWQRSALQVGAFTDVERIRMVNAQVGFVLAEDNILLATSDSGRTWQQRSVIPASTIVTDIQFVSEQVGFAVGGISFNIEESSVWRTNDGGRTWTQIRGTKNMPLFGLATRSNTLATAVGNTTILNTQNGGQLWATQLPLPGNPDNFAKLYRSTAFVNANLGYIAGEDGRILKTLNGGTTWIQPMASRNAFNDWYDVAFANDTVGWVVGANTLRITGGGTTSFRASPVVFQTRNGGVTWTEQALPRDAVSDTAQSIHAASERTAFAVGNQGTIYATRDGGTTWTRQTSPTRSNLFGVFFLNENLGWAVGGTSESAVIIQTSDGGATWRRQLAPADGALRSVYFVNAQQGYAAGINGILLATRNGGATWESQESRTTADLFDISFTSLVNGVVVGDRGTILSTNNGGYTPQARTGASVIDFGSVSVRDNSTRLLTISAENLLEGLTITAPQGFSMDYANLRNQSQITLQPNALASTQAALTLRFQPNDDGTVTRLLRISSAFISSTVALTGTGLNRPVLRFDSQTLNFGQVLVGASTQASIRVSNIGTTSGIVSLQVLPLDTLRNPVFRTPVFVRAPELRANARDTASFELSFSPRTFGIVNAVLQVQISQGNFDTTYAVRLTGTGLQAVIRPSSQILEFGETSILQETQATLGIFSVGNIPATIRQISIEPQGAFVFRTPLAQILNTRLQPSESVILPLGFIPQTLGFTRATLTIESDAGTQRVVLVGNAVPLLAAPTLVSPFNGRINTPVSAIFAWRNVSEALAYDVQISRDSTFRTVDVDRKNERSLAYSPTNDLLNNATYYWRVKSRTVTASSEWSPVWAFETVRPLQRVRNTPETVQISGYVGQTQRGVFSLRSVSNTTISRAFWQSGSDAAFSLRQDQFPLVLRSNVTEFLTFDFSPSKVSSDVRGILVLISPLDTHKVQIIGEALPVDSTAIFTRVAVQTDRTNASVGDTLKIQVVLKDSRNLDTLRNRNKAQTFSALLKVRNETVLAAAPILTSPQNLSNNVFLGNGGKTIELRDIPRTSGMKSGVLAEIPALVLLGNATSTVVEFLSFQWNDAAENRILQSVVDSSVAVVNCNAGGVRLLKQRNGNTLTALSPNPASNQASVKFGLLETGQTELFLVNVLGQSVRTFFAQEKSSGEYAETLDITGLPDGLYTLVLKTPSGILQQRIGVVK